MITFMDYQSRTHATAVYPKDISLLYLTLGLAGEAGEVANKIKKIYRDADGIVHSERKKDLANEIGDCLWYLSELCNVLNLDFGEVAKDNILKLRRRYEQGTIKGEGENRIGNKTP